jgi:hypothetical protein
MIVEQDEAERVVDLAEESVGDIVMVSATDISDAARLAGGQPAADFRKRFAGAEQIRGRDVRQLDPFVGSVGQLRLLLVQMIEIQHRHFMMKKSHDPSSPCEKTFMFIHVSSL